ncbi:MAG: hypothetical protein QXU99_07515 [Candidatus Bathyarchaeia archaeon]
MKGKTPWNKPSIKKTDMYRLLLDLGGEARWKDLKANLKKLGWGPTTLKQTLDEMVKEGSVIKEARLGPKGPEAWYKVQIKDRDIWTPFEEAINSGITSLEQVVQGMREKAEKLEVKEREVFLKAQMQKLAEMARDSILALFYMMAKGAFKKDERTMLLAIFNYLFDSVYKKQIKEYAEILMDYPKQSLEALLDLLIADKDKREEALRAEGLKN